MKATMKKEIEEITNGNYVVLFEATEKLTQTWKYYVIWNGNNNKYLAAWNTTERINKYDFHEFDTYGQAKKYLTDAIV